MSFRKYLPQPLINYGRHLPDAIISNLKYGFPGRKLKVIGVTGTDGKTTTVNMIYKVLKDAGRKVSMISTINAVIAGKSYDTGFHVTSPHPEIIQKFLSQSVKHGDEYFILEITSHALDQFRNWGIPIEIGVITNITREHLDYHKTMKNYVNSKAKLIKNAKVAVLNRDDENFSRLQATVDSRQVITFGMSNSADVNAKSFPLKLKLPGEYNVLNALAATAVARKLAVSDAEIKKSLESFTGLIGRMEEIPNNKGIKLIVDFAHTPNALEQSFTALKKQTSGKLIVVFGAASQRDEGKRPIMGQIAGKLADIIVLTSEDPRFEDPTDIINQIATGAITVGAKPNQTLFKEVDRQKAIDLALSLAKKGDIVGVFGKGHESTMNIKGKELPWSDQIAVQKALKSVVSR